MQNDRTVQETIEFHKTPIKMKAIPISPLLAFPLKSSNSIASPPVYLS